ncbi:uncharacterized protein [Lolium perenne]|uniref:uncharacterized protein n=1 Tax=Lolium perenne TaxID=4522 RepID=UPI003A9A1CEE
MDVQNIYVAVWNARGLNNPARRSAVRIEVDDAQASVVCVSESKLQSVTQFDIAQWFGARFDGFVYVPAVGSAGGVLVAWRSEDVRVLASRVDRFSVSIHIVKGDGAAWWLTTVYGPTCDSLKDEFLNELRMLRAAIVGPWAVTGRRFTWSNSRAEPTLVKLDRWFASVDWEELHPDVSLSALTSSISDHCPILMSTAVASHFGKRFRFERFWLKLEGFMDTAKVL